MLPINFYATAAAQFATHGGAILKLEYEVVAGGAAGFVQLHDSQGTPAAFAVPLKPWATSGGGDLQYKEFKSGELRFSHGLCLVLSSTEATYTAVATTFNVASAELEEADESVTVVGDKTTGDSMLTIWSEATGPKKLRKLEVHSTSANARYVLLFAHDSPADGDLPIAVLGYNELAAKDFSFDFGKAGRDVFSYTAAHVLKDGCTVALSSTVATLTQVPDGTNTIRAEYI